MNDFISIVKILNFHGINGELKVGFTKGKEEQISNLKEVFLLINGEYKSFKVSSVRFHKQFAIMKLKEFILIFQIRGRKNAMQRGDLLVNLF